MYQFYRSFDDIVTFDVMSCRPCFVALRPLAFPVFSDVPNVEIISSTRRYFVCRYRSTSNSTVCPYVTCPISPVVPSPVCTSGLLLYVGVRPDRVTYSTLIHALSKSGDCDGAWEVRNRELTIYSVIFKGGGGVGRMTDVALLYLVVLGA